MFQSMSKKVPVSISQQPLQSPFLALSSEGLREGAENPSTSLAKNPGAISLEMPPHPDPLSASGEREVRGPATCLNFSAFLRSRF